MPVVAVAEVRNSVGTVEAVETGAGAETDTVPVEAVEAETDTVEAEVKIAAPVAGFEMQLLAVLLVVLEASS
jgi:hypothetical protein